MDYSLLINRKIIDVLIDKSDTSANLLEWQTYYNSPETCLDIKNSFIDDVDYP